MSIQNKYYAQVELLLSVLPVVFEEKIFAMKGGTAINLFTLIPHSQSQYIQSA